MDEKVPNHISPIFYDLFIRTYLHRSGLNVVAHLLYPPDGYIVTRAHYANVLRILARVLPGHTLGDIHVFVLQPVIKEQPRCEQKGGPGLSTLCHRLAGSNQAGNPPLSLLCVATPVSLSGYTVKIIDQRIEPDWRSILTKSSRKTQSVSAFRP